jgi:uncharacterized protein (DUF305 family)
MKSIVPTRLLMAAFALAAAPRAGVTQAVPPPSPVLGTTALGHYPYTVADVQFITGMISHHAQALVMARWAPTHGAGETVRNLCERIINAQSDEINLMSNWLKDRHQPVPEPKPMPMKMMMNGVEQDMLMPGMLSDAQMNQLDAARGPEFDRLFLTFMIQHHRGALTMVNDLFATPGAGQDEVIYKLASDVYADQSTEIERMQKLILTLTVNGGN